MWHFSNRIRFLIENWWYNNRFGLRKIRCELCENVATHEILSEFEEGWDTIALPRCAEHGVA